MRLVSPEPDGFPGIMVMVKMVFLELGQGHKSEKTQNLLLLQYRTNYAETTGYIQFRMMDTLPNRLKT